MASLAIQGCQWGDEGKGKITDYCAQKADIVVRSQGGNNAGHSIVRNGVRYALKLLPSGIFNPKVINVLADGVVINPWALLDEIKGIKEAGVTNFQLYIGTRATLLMPYHIDLDKAREVALGNAKIGTTGKGIGPCYEDRSARTALRMGDLLEPAYLHERLSEVLILKNKELVAFGAQPYDLEDLYGKLMAVGKELTPYIHDTSNFLGKALSSGKNKVLFEGAQGAMLDLSFGTYPYVTSSSPMVTAIPENCGIPFNAVNSVLGIVKAYTTRVGAGPFPSEIANLDLASKIREKGHEYGTVTKRPRRIGWLDACQLRYVMSISGVKSCALMLLDVLGDLDEIKICNSYSLDGKIIDYMPATVDALARVVPSFVSLPSWKGDISQITRYDALPPEAKNYIATIEEITGLHIDMISVGPDQKQTIIRKEVF
jgi:adenylosuccinate synthase